MRLLLVFASGCLCFGQSLSMGVKGGIRAMDDITNITGGASGRATSESKRYIVGPMLELGLPLGFGAEFDALYNREGYEASFGDFFGNSFERERANAWQFPLLLKYKLPFPIVKPYVEAGYALGVINGSIDGHGVTIDLGTGQQTPYVIHTGTNWKPSHGFAAGSGIQVGFGRLRLSPEIRYTHWNSAAISGGFGSSSFQSAQNQLDVLVGISWQTRR